MPFALATDSADARPLIAIRPDRLDTVLAGLSAHAATAARVQGFTAEPASWCLLSSASGGIEAVLVGIADVDDPFALGALPLLLPRGRYRLHDSLGERIDPARAALGWGLGAYQFTRYRAPKREPAELHVDNPARAQAERLLDASWRVRDLVNTPTEHMGPAELADAVVAVGNSHGARVRVIEGDDLLHQNFPAIHAVGRASHRAPRLIELDWGNDTHPKLALVGKGVCFDTGGLDIKPADGMLRMKKDMGGAAHALALAQLVMVDALPVRLKLLIPAVENAIGPNAYRPGEVIATRKGLSVEIGNTDAEGRVILSDALAYAGEWRPDLLLDFATLTGAARIALGPDLPALFVNDETLAADLARASALARDPLWRMPLYAPYLPYLESPIADINNAGATKHAGSITAALFLQRFVPEGQAWAHVDVYAWNDAPRPGRPAGGEAQSLRAFQAMLAARYR
jgi:leucyl aminopeptidase